MCIITMAKLNISACIFLLCIVAVKGSTDSPVKPEENIKPTQAADRNLVCSEVREIFVTKKIGTAEMVPQSPVSGMHLEVCKAQSTCCTPEMEEKYKQSVRNTFLNNIHLTTSHVKNSIVNNIDKLQENILDMIRVSENNTNVLFSRVYPRMWNEAHDSITRLFSDMVSYTKGESAANLQSSVANFFNSLFPLVYHHNINPKMQHLDDQYNKCMQLNQEEIEPFGDVARHVTSHVSKSLRAARALIQALTVGVEAMNLTDYVPVSGDCERALLRLTHCPHCRGYVSAKPCPGYCLNVVHGCLSGAADMEQSWNDYVVAFETLVSGMKGAYNVEEVTSTLDSKMSEAVMHAMENGPEISRKVKQVCGQPQTSSSDSPLHDDSSSQSATTTTTPDKMVPIRSSSSPDLYTRLQNLMKNLSPSKNIFSSLAFNLCNDDTTGVRGDTNCWNGDDIGEYTKTIVGVSMSAQKYNPELELDQTTDEKIAQLVDKLKAIRQMILTSANPAPEADTLMNDGSGSGNWRRNNDRLTSDDEDYDDSDVASGSGNGDGDDDGYNGHSRSKNTNKWTSQKPDTDDDLQIEESGASSRDDDGQRSNPGSTAASTIQMSSYMSALSVLVIFILSPSLTVTSW